MQVNVHWDRNLSNTLLTAKRHNFHDAFTVLNRDFRKHVQWREISPGLHS